MRIFLFLFITIPLAELYLLIEVGRGIGGLSTIALCLLTAAIGGILVRMQGMQTLLQARTSFERGEVSSDPILHGILLALAGLLLFLPGLITDVAGFLLLIPALRRWIGNRIPHTQMHSHRSQRHGETIIEAEIIEERDHLP